MAIIKKLKISVGKDMGKREVFCTVSGNTGKTLMLGKTEGKRRWRQRMTWLHSITDAMDMN